MRQPLIQLRQRMADHGFAACLIPTTDVHGSEYVHDHFQCRRYISGFTGSAGTLVVTMDEAKLWTDGRYFLQAAAQLKDTGIDLMKMGQPGVPTIKTYLESVLTADDILAFDGRVMDYTFGSELEAQFTIAYQQDLAGEIWTDRPAIIPSGIYPLDESVTGEPSAAKLARVRKFMAEKDADMHLLTSLEDIAWLYNLRGNDIAHTPVFFAFALLTPEEDRLYVMDTNLEGAYPYEQIYEDIQHLPKGRILLNQQVVNYTLMKLLPPEVEVISSENPTTLMKTLKNEVEIAATKKAHLRDGAAMVNFLYWLKTRIGHEVITELSAAEVLAQYRQDQGANDVSFATIAGYAEHGAIVHYSATPESNKTLAAEGFLLADSGGQYSDGTTDITRTIALGVLTEEMKRHYTAVLCGHIDLSSARFHCGTTGASLDALARKPLQALGLDYNHGTGHGVGHLLSCHEGPQSISPRGTQYAILPGMINSDEPGLYLEGQYGIRLENEILCVEEPDGMLTFRPLTFCPFERAAILAEHLNEKQLAWLNAYHHDVYQQLAPLLEPDVRTWLAEACAPITL